MAAPMARHAGLIEQFGDQRVIDTPISEATIAGAAVGAAMTGLRPVAEIMYVDFTPLAMDQLANQGAKNRYMFGGKTMVPLTMRTEGGTGRGIAAHHSQSLEALWVHFPGIYVVMPSTPYDAKGLLKACIRDDNPIMFIEHKMLYSVQGPVPEEEYLIPLGVADVKRTGKDVTVVAYSRMALTALEAAEALAKEGIEVEVVDPRTLKPLDMDTIVASVKKTGRVVCVTEAYRTGSFAAEVASRIQEQAFDWLDAPVTCPGRRRRAGADGGHTGERICSGAATSSLPCERCWPRWQPRSFCLLLARRWMKAPSLAGLCPMARHVKKGQVIAEIESNKAVFELEATATGRLDVVAEAGAAVPILTVIAHILAPGEKRAGAGAGDRSDGSA